MTTGQRQLIREKASALGFDRIGFCGVPPTKRDAAAYRRWIDSGMDGEMHYMSRPDRVDRTLDPRLTLPGARSMVVVALSFAGATLPRQVREDPSRGLFARYAWGPDYHEVMLPRLEELGAFVSEVTGRPAASQVSESGGDPGDPDNAGDVSDAAAGADAGGSRKPAEPWRAYVDTGPLLERDAAVRGGLGFMGRNTMLIDPRRGSWLFLGEVLVDADLGADWADAPPESAGAPESESGPELGTCGQCTRCLDGCPTHAFPEPYVLDARRCLSYLTIELKGPIPRHLRTDLGNRVFGCDICNDVCPYNLRLTRGGNRSGAASDPGPASDPDPAHESRPPDATLASTSAEKPPVSAEKPPLSASTRPVPPAPDLTMAAPPLLELAALDDDGFRDRFRGTPVYRGRRRRLMRNVCVALGNWASPEAVPPLVLALDDPEPLIRGHAAWALGRIGSKACLAALHRRLASETDPWVTEEIRLAASAAG